jgi:hypothetical protein
MLRCSLLVHTVKDNLISIVITNYLYSFRKEIHIGIVFASPLRESHEVPLSRR